MRMMFSALAMFAAFALRATELAAPDAAHAPETRKHQGIPSVAVSKANGRMWCTYYCDPLGGENHLNYCVLAIVIVVRRLRQQHPRQRRLADLPRARQERHLPVMREMIADQLLVGSFHRRNYTTQTSPKAITNFEST